MLEALRAAYSLIEQFSVTGLVVAAIVFVLAFLFAVREAASWFFKIDDIKRDVRNLHDVVLELEGEIRSLQKALTAGRENIATSNEKSTSDLHLASVTKTAAAAATDKPKQFPIVH
jgi:uncharacterized protein (DUF3084 family)